MVICLCWQVTSLDFSTTGPKTAASKTTFVTSTQVQCKLSQSGNYLVTVANSNGLESAGLPFVTYNPECYECNENGTCSLKVRLW